jgi:hypothetical protein
MLGDYYLRHLCSLGRVNELTFSGENSYGDFADMQLAAAASSS